MDVSNYSLIKLISGTWVFGKPLILTLIVFVIVRKGLNKKWSYLLFSFLGSYMIWYITGNVMLPWMARSVSTGSFNYGELMFKTAATQAVEVLCICLFAYGISKVPWFRNYNCS